MTDPQYPLDLVEVFQHAHRFGITVDRTDSCVHAICQCGHRGAVRVGENEGEVPTLSAALHLIADWIETQ